MELPGSDFPGMGKGVQRETQKQVCTPTRPPPPGLYVHIPLRSHHAPHVPGLYLVQLLQLNPGLALKSGSSHNRPGVHPH